MTTTEVPLDARPQLVSKARLRTDRTSGETLLLYPERGLKLNPTGVAVLQLCTGAMTVAEIAAALAAQHGGDLDRILSEVREFLGQLAARGLLRGVAP
jgi:pyrroloquinoline quinone biosynthesis protein D